MKVLLTGFDPFGGEKINPSFEAVRRVGNIEGAKIVKIEIPTVYERGAEVLLQAVEREKPDLVILTGQAGGRAKITPEVYALNVRSASIPDNAGRMAHGEPILADAPIAYRTKIDAEALVSTLNAKENVFAVSYHAGTFVCNELYFRLLHAIAVGSKPTLGLFVHVPFIPEQTSVSPSLPLPTITRNLEALIREMTEKGPLFEKSAP